MLRKNYLYLFIAISAFVACYLFYVDLDRKHSIQKYFPHPQVGDVYKIKSDAGQGDSWLQYYKVTEVYADKLVFYPSIMMADASTDIILNHFDTTNTIVYSIKELTAIKNGEWKNTQRNNTSLVEIVRRN